MIRWLCLGLWLLGLALAQNTVRVVAAADLQYALTEIAQRFERRNAGLRVELAFGSSGKLYTQLMQGLPADVFFSADEAFPMQLQQAGRVEPGTLRLYAVGRLVIWASNALVQQGLDPRRLGPRILLDPRITQLAIANPMHAPYGRAGVTLLEHFGLLRSTRPVRWEEMTGGIAAYYDLGFLRRGKAGFEFVYGENISQTAQLALTSTNIGLVALSLARSEAMEQCRGVLAGPFEQPSTPQPDLRNSARPEPPGGSALLRVHGHRRGPPGVAQIRVFAAGREASPMNDPVFWQTLRLNPRGRPGQHPDSAFCGAAAGLGAGPQALLG
ncbi:MAG: molybdate-binding protein [Meiothermus sp.]|nr:MAG: molybdate-binding protein [Meiothermus sp.]